MTNQKENLEQRMAFEIGGEIYAMDVLAIKEVLRHSGVTPIPHSPHFVLGLINLRGSVVTVIDGRKRMNVKEAEVSEETRVIIVDSEEHSVGILVDSVREVVDIDKDSIMPHSNSATDVGDYVHGICHINDELHILLDHTQLLSEA
ncbi:Positive regulator of CheA protein activity (CheW) [Vibrio chagasii]|nr:Positive regulator of CheA protein activity (CheW) [Vibrio chagasii]